MHPAARVVGASADGLLVAWTDPPTPAQARAGSAACLLDGEIYNLEEVARLAQIALLAAPEATLAAAYERMGDSFVAHLRGEFALMLWDARSDVGLLVRDQLGSASLYLHAGAGRLLFASELPHLLEALARTPAPDAEALVQWAAQGTVPPDRTLYKGIAPLAPGSLLRLRGGGWESARYWTPRYREPLGLDRDAAARQLRRAVTAAVSRRLEARRAAGVLISGGLDSGTVLAVARSATDGGEATLRTYSAAFPAHRTMDESDLIDLEVERHGVSDTRIPVTGGSPLQASLRYLDRWRVPLPVPGHFIWEPLLAAAAHDGAECMLDGELGDELFGAASFLIADRLRGGDIRDAAKLAGSLAGVGRGRLRFQASILYQNGVAAYLPPWLARRGAAPAWLVRTEARRHAARRDPLPWRALEGPRGWAQLADTVMRGPDRLGFGDYFRRRGRAAGVPAHHPFLDLDLIEFVLRLPPEYGFDQHFSRPLLRRAMRGLVPEEVRMRRGKSYFDPLLVDCLAVDDRSVAQRLLGARDAEVLSFADRSGVQALLERGPAGHGQGPSAWARDVWRLVTVECWLRSQADPGFARDLLDEVSGRGERAPTSRRVGRSYVYQS